MFNPANFLIILSTAVVVLTIILSIIHVEQKKELETLKKHVCNLDITIVKKQNIIDSLEARAIQKANENKVNYLAAQYLAVTALIRYLDEFASKSTPSEFNYINVKNHLIELQITNLAQYQSAIKDKENQ